MPSTFECPVCQSRYNTFVTSVWDAASITETTTYQCKGCLNLFEIKRVYSDDDEDELAGEWASNEDGFFDSVYGRGISDLPLTRGLGYCEQIKFQSLIGF